jgi:hypothetical protein
MRRVWIATGGILVVLEVLAWGFWPGNTAALLAVALACALGGLVWGILMGLSRVPRDDT